MRNIWRGKALSMEIPTKTDEGIEGLTEIADCLFGGILPLANPDMTRAWLLGLKRALADEQQIERFRFDTGIEWLPSPDPTERKAQDERYEPHAFLRYFAIWYTEFLFRWPLPWQRETAS